MMHSGLRSFKKRLAAGAVSLLVVGGLALPFGMAFAQTEPPLPPGVGMPVGITGSVPDTVKGAFNNIVNNISTSAVTALFNALSQFMGKLATDAATFIATGGQGQEAAYWKQPAGTYFENVAKDAAGQAIGDLSDDKLFQALGFDFCRPKDPREMLRLQLDLNFMFRQIGISPPSGATLQNPKCDFDEIRKNYESLSQAMSNNSSYATIETYFQPNSSEISTRLGLMGGVKNYVEKTVTSKIQTRGEGDGYKSIIGKIDQSIKTPGQLIKEQTTEAFIKTPAANQTLQVQGIMTNAFKVGPVQLLSYTASVFVSTLVNQTLKTLFSLGIGGKIDLRTIKLGPEEVVVTGKSDARQAGISFRAPQFNNAPSVDLVSEMISSCEQNRGPWSCAMDQSLAKIVKGAGEAGGATIQKALRDDNLHGGWQLIPTMRVKENQDPKCFEKSYCAGNLQKLRLARILPVGFELAANHEENIKRCTSSQGCVTLNEVVKEFNNPDSPWYRLIDESWVITSIPQQCAMNGYGDSLLTGQLNQRREECVDVQTCLQRNDKGECVGGYGYCVADKTVYRFNASECPARFASCRSYTSRQNASVSYLRNTLDYGQCSADNVGCQWYATTRNPGQNRTDNWTGTISQGDRMYFDKTLETCSAQDEGCTKLLAVRYGEPSMNFLRNASFEGVVTGNLVSWSTVANFTAPFVVREIAKGTSGYDGLSSVRVGANNAVEQLVALDPLRMHTLSVSSRAETEGVQVGAQVSVTLYKDAAGTVPLVLADAAKDFRKLPECTLDGNRNPSIQMSSNSTDWKRYDCSFLTSALAKSARIRVTGTGALVDAVQLEESEFSNDYVDGLNQSLTAVHLKVAPDEFACNGLGGSQEHAACKKFAGVCRQSEAGCQGYTDLAGGGQEIPAIVSKNDLCPSECVGYAQYRKSPSAFDLVRETDARFDDPEDENLAFFIPKTAGQCTQADVGCQAFTNTEQVAAGGERTAYFKYARSCEKPDANTQTYFTWEGSDTAGYQLRTWSLKKDGGRKIQQNEAANGPKVLEKRGPDQTQFKEPVTCNKDSWLAGLDPDCREFYDAAGNVFYRYLSQTVLSTAQCTNYRLNGVKAGDCKASMGALFNASTGECTYQIFAPESLACTAQAVSCRAYAGVNSGNKQTVYPEAGLVQDFRSGVGGFTGPAVTTSTESLRVGDSSLRVDGSGNPLVASASVNVETSAQGLYEIVFWAKAPAAANGQVSLVIATADLKQPQQKTQVATVGVNADWRRYSVGPFSGAAGASTSTVSFAAGTGRFYLDEVSMTKIQDMVYVRSNTWNTPAMCDESSSGTPQPQAMLGCRAYRNRLSETVNVREFSRLCRDRAIGCTAFVDTRNSLSAGAEQFVQKDAKPIPTIPGEPGSPVFEASTTTRSADRYLYLIDEPAKRCKQENASCRAFGKPYYTTDRTALAQVTSTENPSLKTSFETVYFKDDITKYAEALCKPSELFCEEYSAGAGKEYFRSPNDQVCEYRERVTLDADDITAIQRLPGAQQGLAAGDYSGWFRPKSDLPCYPGILESGRTFGMARVGDKGYRGWGATCAQEYNSCTEFRDKNDTTDPVYKNSGKPYYFLNDDNLDKSCEEGVDVANGCILLRDMSNTRLSYNTKATYDKYRAEGYKPTAPINCESSSRDSYCGNMTTNDANMLVRVRVDRDCAQWLGCKSAITVLDPVTKKYKDICSDLALCDKGSGNPDDIFCANYVDQTNPQTEPILTSGSFFDVKQYAKRSVGLGQKDYTGYTIPNAFQVMDLTNARVAYDGVAGTPANKDPNASKVRSTFGQEYRLAAMVRIPMVADGGLFKAKAFADLQPYEATVVDAGEQIVRDNPGLALCRHKGTGLVGYYRLNDKDQAEGQNTNFFCYLPIRRDDIFSDQDATVSGYQFEKLAKAFSSTLGATDPVMQKAYPSAECRSYPEVDSPFPASYVTEWQTSKNPPRAREKIQGYRNVNTCEFGEECSCAYKRVEYSGAALTKFYNPTSPAVPPGICQGGPRDGQGCLPESIFKVPAQSGSGQPSAALSAAELANAAQTCGPPEQGGRCVSFSKVEVIRGVFGNCLERDFTRTTGEGFDQNPCLTWNPTPILLGDKDPYHYQPTSGYLPPENSGQYYCIDKAKSPRQMRLRPEQFEGSYDTKEILQAEDKNKNPVIPEVAIFKPVTIRTSGTEGICPDEFSDACFFRIRNLSPLADYNSAWEIFSDKFVGQRFSFAGRALYQLGYDSSFVSAGNNEMNQDNTRVTYGGWPGATFDGGKIEYSPTARQCELADQHQDESADNDPTALRLVAAGGMDQSNASSYSETFYQLKTNDPRSMQQWLDNGQDDISFISVRPMENQSKRGRLGCGYQSDWVEGIEGENYGDAGWLEQSENQWKSEFYKEYKGVLTRGSVRVLAGEQGKSDDLKDDQPILVKDCLTFQNRQNNPDGCYLSFWETSYQANGEESQLFKALKADQSNEIKAGAETTLQNIRKNPIFEYCQSDRPYFGIRAVFETPANKIKKAHKDTVVEDVTALGSGQLAGFWVSTCAPKAKDYRYIYMSVDINTASVCKQVAEVRSSASNQDAAFTDRVWKNSGYRPPVVAFQYGARYAPYSSALAVGTPNTDPLFQTGGALAGFSELTTNSFLGSGVDTYYRNNYSNPDADVIMKSVRAGVANKVDEDIANKKLAPELREETIQKLSDALYNASLGQYPPNESDKYGFLTNLFARVYRIYVWDEAANKYSPRNCNGSDDTEFCGLLAYDITDKSDTGSLAPLSKPLPTDVTLGHYTPAYLGFKGDTVFGLGGIGIGTQFETKAFDYISYYTPRPPRVAAPDTRACPLPGQCPIQRMDTFALDGQSDGVVNVGGGQHKATARFYAWAAHNQMPLRSVVIDWGDGTTQELPDAKLKNRKPFCNVRKECSDPVRGSGLTCQSDKDCPAGTGTCKETGWCKSKQNISCFQDSDCPSVNGKNDTCTLRTFFGDSAEACEQNYFELSHVYTCANKDSIPQGKECAVAGEDSRCSRDPERLCSQGCAAGDTCLPGLAPKRGCFDTLSNSCRFTPRLILTDNWGWCTGECRSVPQGNGNLTDSAGATVLHPYGGCYSWSTHGEQKNIKLNTNVLNPNRISSNECSSSLPSSIRSDLRPWIVYPGSLQIRSAGIAN